MAYCYWVAWSVGWSVCHTSEPCENGWTDRDAVWVEDSVGPREPCIRWGPDPHGKGQFWGEVRIIPLQSTGTLCGHVCKNSWTDRDAVWAEGSDGPKEACVRKGPEVMRDIAMATNFQTQVAITGFVWMIATRWLVMEGGLSGWPSCN